jgi:molybdate transport system ATP-binding protein
MAEALVVLEQVAAAHGNGAAALHAVTWTLHDGEVWAIVGGVASGKSSLADVLRGQLRITNGSIAWPLLERLRAAGATIAWPADVIQTVSFKEESKHFSYGKHYYQQRFNFIEPEDDLTLRAFLRRGLDADDEAIVRVAAQVGIADLLELSLIKLSNGQTRRARIARALLAQPELLILDDPYMGLDASGRADITRLLGELLTAGQRLLLIAPPDVLPPWVTHILELRELSSVWQGPRAMYQPPPGPIPTDVTSVGRAAQPIIELTSVNVSYASKAILRDLSWTVCQGERWALLGPNGSGKTTLLSLIAGDHPQAYANAIKLFGRQRGTGESIWDIKRQIGLVSPELHFYFSMPLTVTQVVATGYFDVLVPRPTTADQDAAIQELLATFDLNPVAQRPFARLSTGEQRLVLILRALVKQPALLILDEPFQGLDRSVIDRLRTWLDTRLLPTQTLVFVTHYENEIPACVTQRLHLRDGQAQ